MGTGMQTTNILALPLALLLAGCPGPVDLPALDAGIEEPDPIGDCCECLVSTDLLGEPCAIDFGKCTLQLSDGELPSSARCMIGGRPYCSEECGRFYRDLTG